MPRILIVDDEKNMLMVLEMVFRSAGYEIFTAESGTEALSYFQKGENFDVVISDLKMEQMDGIQLLKALIAQGRMIPFVLITAYGTVERAVEAMKLGAVDVITKPFTKEMILNVVDRICRMEKLEKENQILRTSCPASVPIYRSIVMEKLMEMVQKIGPTTAPVLLVGESGTGKEVIARAIHRCYCKGEEDLQPFVSINCPAIPEHLLESELFGYRKGAFTGAVKDYRGKIELADGGTLFLDEIGDLPLSVQPKLLRLLENKTFEPLGTGAVRRVNIRVLCATNRDLSSMVAEGAFREDLYYRINTFTLRVPPLRERKEDIPILAEYFLEKYAEEMGKPTLSLSESVKELLKQYNWPGNVRELRNVIERAVVLCNGNSIELDDLPAEIRGDTIQLKEERHTLPNILVRSSEGENLLAENEKRMILEALDASRGNVSLAAKLLGISRNTLRYRMQKYGLSVTEGGGNQPLRWRNSTKYHSGTGN